MANLNHLLERLLSHPFNFVLVGGYAGVLHGSTQVTRDIDICMDLDPNIIKELRLLLADLHPTHRQTPQKLSFLEHPSGLTNVRNLYLQTDLGPLDILSEITGVGSYKTVEAHAVSVLLADRNLRVIGVDDLIKAKKAMGREKDLATILELELFKKQRDARSR